MADYSEPPSFKSFRRAVGADWLTLMSGAFSVPAGFLAAFFDGWGRAIWTALALLAFGYATYRIWAHERRKVIVWEDLAKKSVHVEWRFSEGKAQLILRNRSIKTHHRVEVMARNWCSADGQKVSDLLCGVPTVDGKAWPNLNLDPGTPYYFTFAAVKMADITTPTIAIVPDSNRSVWVGKEAGIKFSFLGGDTPYQEIKFRLRLEGTDTIDIQPWVGDKAVSDSGIAIVYPQPVGIRSLISQMRSVIPAAIAGVIRKLR